MRITLGQLKRIIKEEVSRIREAQGELDLGRHGVPKAHRHALDPEPPPGFVMDTESSEDGHHIYSKTPNAHGDRYALFHSAHNPDTGETRVWSRGAWVKRTATSAPYRGSDSGHSMDRTVGNRNIGNAWRESGY